uniref:Rho GTPase-activating protein 68F (inferred by orthology to a D. melanogaster protein) n=1 Tax=Strongyloides venezuelensis TaxID=75913 RepID=A0A0K0F2D8_STRVS
MNEGNEHYDKEFVDPIDGFADDDLISPNDFKDCDPGKVSPLAPVKSFLERDNFESELGSPSDEIYNVEFDEISKLNIIDIIAEGDRAGRPIVCVYAFRLPSSKTFNHEAFLQFLQHILDKYVDLDYSLIYFHYGLRSNNKPPIRTLIKAFNAFDRRYKKNLKVLAVIHPTRFIKFLWKIFQPFISIKFERKMHYMNYLSELNDIVPVSKLNLPQPIIDYDTSLSQNSRKISLSILPENNMPLPTAQFNVSLDYILNHHPESELPPIVIDLVTFLRSYGLKTQGIFRLSGEVTRINRLQERINLGEKIDFLTDEKYKDNLNIAIIDASALLKVFLRSLGEPIITNALYPQLITALDVPKGERKEGVKGFIKLLPKQNLILLKYIIEFLLDVTNNEHENKMDANNLSVIFGPNLTWPTNQQVPISQLNSLNNFCYILISEYEYIFSGY